MNKIFLEVFYYLLEAEAHDDVLNRIVKLQDQIAFMDNEIKNPNTTNALKTEYTQRIKVFQNNIKNLKSKLGNMGIKDVEGAVAKTFQRTRNIEQIQRIAKVFNLEYNEFIKHFNINVDTFHKFHTPDVDPKKNIENFLKGMKSQPGFKSNYTNWHGRSGGDWYSDFSNKWNRRNEDIAKAELKMNLIIIGVFGVAFIWQIVYHILKFKKEQIKRICSSFGDGYEYQQCVRNYKKRAYLEVIQQLEKQKEKCKSTKNPEKCIKKVQKVIDELKEKIQNAT